MKEFKGTPGEWWVEDESFSSDGEDAVISCEIRYGMVEICRISQGGSERDIEEPFANEQAANANLIAAAPELLEALQDALHAHDKHGEHSEWDFSRAAIAKALGESQ